MLEKNDIRFIKANLLEKEKIINSYKGTSFVIHCAALASPWGRFKNLNMKVHYKNTPYFVALLLASLTETFFKLASANKEPTITKYAVGLMSKSQTLDITAAKKELWIST